MARPATATAPSVNPDLASDCRKIIVELSDVHIERSRQIEIVITTMLAKQHGFILGPPGADKSRMLENIAKRFVGCNYRRALMHRQLGEESLFGQIDMPKYDQQGIWERDIEHTLGDAHLALIDEPDKAGPASFMPLLTWMNERQVKPGKFWLDAPLISAWGAANALLEEELSAIWDRFLVRFSVGYIKEYANLIKLMQSAVRQPGLQVAAPMTTVNLADIQPVIDNVIPAIPIPMGVFETLAQLRFELHGEAIVFSDRRLYQAMPLLQTAAWLDGASEVQDDHLEILVNVLWDHVEEIPKVEEKVLQLTSPLTKLAMDFHTMLEEIHTQLDGLRGEALEALAGYGGTGAHQVKTIEKKLEAAITQAESEGRRTTRLVAVRDMAFQTKVRVYEECMNLPHEKAELMARDRD